MVQINFLCGFLTVNWVGKLDGLVIAVKAAQCKPLIIIGVMPNFCDAKLQSFCGAHLSGLFVLQKWKCQQRSTLHG